MFAKSFVGLAAAGMFVCSVVRASDFAGSVTEYRPGSGIPAGYTNAAAALGEPSRATGGAFPGPVDPFSPPYLAEQVVSLGAGGSLTLRFTDAISDDPSHPFGLDFIVYGNSGFVITNGDFTGGGITDGSLFGANEGLTRVSVSAEGVNFYELTPSLAPVVDGPFPTDGAGDFRVPLDPALKGAAFSGKNLAGIRGLYAGSAGGTAYDLAWARDGQGLPVALSHVWHVRIEVLSGVAEIDGVSIVPEPSTWALLLLGGAGFVAARRRSSR